MTMKFHYAGAVFQGNPYLQNTRIKRIALSPYKHINVDRRPNKIRVFRASKNIGLDLLLMRISGKLPKYDILIKRIEKHKK